MSYDVMYDLFKNAPFFKVSWNRSTFLFNASLFFWKITVSWN